MRRVIDLTQDSADIEPVDSSECAICRKEDEKVKHCFHADNAIQCNPQIESLGSGFVNGLFGTPAPRGCNKWFHKTCLKKWKTQCMVKGSLLTCPCCRACHTFVWAYGQDYDITNCIFKEDFLQYALLSNTWDNGQTEHMIEIYELDLGYRNLEVDENFLPFWVNNARSYHGLLEAAIVGNSLQNVQMLLKMGVVIPGHANYDQEIAAIGQQNDSPLMLAAKAYAASPNDRKEKSMLVFCEVLRECETEEFDLVQPVLYPHKLDVFLYSITMGFVPIVKELVDIFLQKHGTKMLLQYCLMSGDVAARDVFPILYSAMEQSFTPVRMEVAILGCAEVPQLSDGLFNMVYALVPRDLKRLFVTKRLKTTMLLNNRDEFVSLLFHPIIRLDKLFVSADQWRPVVEVLPQCFDASWTSNFAFKGGVSVMRKPHSTTTYSRQLKTMLQRERSNYFGRGKWPFTSINLQLLHVRDNGIRSASFLRQRHDFTRDNIVEILFLRMRCFDFNMNKGKVQELLLDALGFLSAFQMIENMGELITRRFVAPITIYNTEAVFHVDEGGQNVLCFCAERGLVDVYKKVFDHLLGVNDWRTLAHLITDADKRSPLYLSIFHEHLEYTEYLLSQPQSSSAFTRVDKDKRTILMACCTSKTQPWLPKDNEIGGTRKSKRRCTVARKLRKDMNKMVKFLLNLKGIREVANAQDKEGNTALHYAYYNHNMDLAKLLEKKEFIRRDIKNNAGLLARELQVE